MIPNNIILRCDMVRKVRNIFAHNFEIDKIEQIDTKLIKSISQLYKERIQKDENKELIDKFHAIYKFGYSELRTFEKNIKLLREKIDDPNLEKELRRINDERRHTFQEEVIKKGPLRVIDKGNGEIEEIYPHHISVIKNKDKKIR